MATTVHQAFEDFLRDVVNLDPNKTEKARSSRSWLQKQIHTFPEKDNSFPILFSQKDTDFGSFSRRTKKRPLDDIDMLIVLNAMNAEYDASTNTVIMQVPESNSVLKQYCHDDAPTQLNSRKIINKFVNNLKVVPNYDKAIIKRNHEAVTLKLTSYDWNFDIVPCFVTEATPERESLYIIPDGNGHWKFTNPKIDKEKVNRIVDEKGSIVLTVIRLVKYWNTRNKIPTVSSYLIENMILNYFDSKEDSDVSSDAETEFEKVIANMGDIVYQPVLDPKGLQGDLNNLSDDDKEKIADQAYNDCTKMTIANIYGYFGEYEEAINKWREIFSDEFPKFG